ncbi:thioredoxin family protein [Marinagarivorans algicola]|uniref:thioredoxin family protein n=1 Tax=Marinagarivorans algicola TaxID=1513270 RepID=UPI0006B4022C|nr:thioredoxin family protein [Marinagarivorans algicola]
MALTESTMLALNSLAPHFALPSTDGDIVSLADYKAAKGLVVIFICNHCPYVVHIAPALAKIAREYQAKGIECVAISSTDVNAYPADSFDLMKAEKEKQGYGFAYLYDEDQSVAKAYKAACTPDIYVFDAQQKLAYRGQFDNTRPERISSGNYDSSKTPATGELLKAALDLIVEGKPVPTDQVPSMGCNIKWKPGNAPEYFA